MLEGERPERPKELTTQNTHPKEKSGAYKEAATNTPLSSSLIQEQQRWYEWPHEKLVKEFKDYVQQRDKQFGGVYSPEETVRMRLDQENSAHLASPNKKEGSFFFQLKQAWDALAYDRYEPGSSQENLAARSLNYYYGCTDGGPTIKLSHPA
jgi:hypothetical protein